MSDELDRARRELTDRVMGREGVAGTAVTERDGERCLVVYVTREPPDGLVPDSVRGVPVVVERRGPFRAL